MITIAHYPNMDIEIYLKTGYKHGQSFNNGLLYKIIREILKAQFNIKINQKEISVDKIIRDTKRKDYIIYISKREI